MHDVDPAILLLTLYLVGFAGVTTGIFLFKSKVRWGGRTGTSGVPMSSRSRTLFSLTTWMLPLFVITGTLKYRVSAAFGLGFFGFFLGTVISGIVDAHQFRRSRKRRGEADMPVDCTDPSER